MLIIIIVLTISTGCQKVETKNISSEKQVFREKNQIVNASNTAEEIIELTLWSHYGGWELYLEAFRKKHPNIHIKTVVFPYSDYPSILMNALAEGDTPDLIVLDSPHFGAFNGMRGLQDLLEEPFKADRYKNDFTDALWKVGLSFDEEQLLGIPFNTSPKVTYYRTDIMESYGFPSEPDALAAFIQNPHNWLEIAKRLQKEDKWIVQWPHEPVEILESQIGQYDKELNLLRDQETFSEVISIAKTIRQQSLASHIDIWSDEGRQAIKEDKIAMLYLGSWGAQSIEIWAPEQAGKWRVTELPFGVKGWSNASIIAISDLSENKEAAWEFIEFFTFEALGENMIGSVAGYLPARNHPNTIDYTNDFLGGQKEQAFYERIQNEVQEHTLTPLDEKAKVIWKEGIYRGLDWGMAPKEIIESIIRRLEAELGRDREILLQSLQ